jgi:hypothetical protein
MIRMTTALRSFAAAIALSACAGTVSADAPPPDFLAAFVFPSEAASRADEVFVLYADHCGRPHPDARRPAQITRDGQRIAVDIYLVENPAEICLAVLMPSTLVPFSLGTLPKGFYEITRRLHIRSVDGNDYRASTVSGAGIEIGDAPHPAVSGTWHDPNQPGSGLFLNLIPPAPGEPSGRAFLYLLTQRNGLAAWAGGIGQFVDGVLRVGLQGPNLAANAGTAVFEYRGCGDALLRVEGDLGLQFPLGQVRIEQLTRTGGVSDCRPPQRGPLSGR